MEVFLSYSRRDEEIALRLARELRSLGVPVWMDQLDIPLGAAWDDSVEAAVKQSESFLVLLSNGSVKSRNVLDEISYALEQNKQIVPVLLEQCEKPFRIRRLQHIDLSVDFATGVAKIREALGSNADNSTALKTVKRPMATARVKARAAGKEVPSDPPLREQLSDIRSAPVTSHSDAKLEGDPDIPRNWWSTFPGILTGVAGVIAAATALIAALANIGSFNRHAVAPEPTRAVSRDGAPVAASPAPIRYWIRELPTVPGQDATKLFNNALGSWQAVMATTITRADSEKDANVVVETAPNTIAVAETGPPTEARTLPLKITFGSDQKWTARTFEAASCRMLGHILGLGYTQVPDQLMTEGIALESLPLTPQQDDVRKVRTIWKK